MLEQYDKVKKMYPGCIILMRFDDWMSAFNDDAKMVSEACNTILAMSHDGHWYTGFLYSLAEHYIGMLVKAGYKVALAESTDGHTWCPECKTYVELEGHLQADGLVNLCADCGAETL